MMLATMLALLACRRSVPIENADVHINTAVNTMLTQQDVRTAIINACPVTGWVARDIADNTLEATLELRSHTAVVDIIYSPTHYKIVYKKSINLEAKNGKIHPNYNSWINNLRKNIDRELAKKTLQ
jgi:hypothetical protein